MNLAFVLLLFIIHLNKIQNLPTQTSLKNTNFSKNLFYPQEALSKRSSEQGKTFLIKLFTKIIRKRNII